MVYSYKKDSRKQNILFGYKELKVLACLFFHLGVSRLVPLMTFYLIGHSLIDEAHNSEQFFLDRKQAWKCLNFVPRWQQQHFNQKICVKFLQALFWKIFTGHDSTKYFFLFKKGELTHKKFMRFPKKFFKKDN